MAKIKVTGTVAEIRGVMAALAHARGYPL